ncbi:unnamed protein product, partial [Phaeothamnion confervicola]
STVEYELIFHEPRIGLHFQMTGAGRLVVKGRQGLADPIATLPAVGDALVSFNGVSVSGRSYAEVATALRAAGRPLLLRFR